MEQPGLFSIATASETHQIETFLVRRSLNHQHLGWDDLNDWIQNQDVTILAVKDEMVGVLSIPIDAYGNTWVRLCAVNTNANYLEIGHSLFEEFFTRIPEGTRIYSIALWNWYEELLTSLGFQKNDVIVTLERKVNRDAAEFDHRITNFEHRQITKEDLLQIHRLDHAAFSSPWQLTIVEIENAFQKSDCRTCITDKGKIIAYQLSAMNRHTAHISRIAVHPSYQKKGVATNLLTHIIKAYRQTNAWYISVNTQIENLASLALYRKFGFTNTGDDFPVYSLITH